MNKVILKQKGKEKAKDKQKIRITKELIEVRLLQHFQYHIGEEEKTSAEEIFQQVIGVNPSEVDSFSRFYWWQSIEAVIRLLRRRDRCFILKKKGYFYVLKTENEAEYYKGLCDNAIKRLEDAKIRADDWVAQEKYKDITTQPIEEPVQILSPEQQATTKIQNAQRKIIKLFKK